MNNESWNRRKLRKKYFVCTLTQLIPITKTPKYIDRRDKSRITQQTQDLVKKILRARSRNLYD